MRLGRSIKCLERRVPSVSLGYPVDKGLELDTFSYYSALSSMEVDE